MSALSKIKRALTVMCVIYTVIISMMFFAGWIMSNSASLFVPTPSKALLMLVFSCILGFASMCLSKEGTSLPRLILHFLICAVSYVLTFVVGGGFSLTGDTSIVAVIAFIILYGIVMGIRAIVCMRYRKNNVKSEAYTSVFK